MNLDSAVNEINNLWIKNGTNIFQYTGRLWHSGLIDFQNLALQANKVVWFTNDANRQDYYNGWAKDDAERNNKTAYKSELVSNGNLRLANFDQDHFHQITMTHLNSQHSNLNTALYFFCIANKIDGIIRGENLNEIAIITTKIHNLQVLKKTNL
ncbi:hypothetical protein EUX50_05325 [Haemophilus haemolyticus]|uniref:Uncharacterized protein n=1 Tax=Haemophilus haemolyticus TaxID=726 RepID=A0ABY2YQ71_HAEHA|nr:hypothetical protein [Haemophilus haemolyticus]TPH04672.1 hypothetical protein EUX50_05325 [Haemophilus haemolyticus]